MISDIRLIPFTFRLDPRSYDLVVKESQKSNVPRATIVREALEKYFQEDIKTNIKATAKA